MSGADVTVIVIAKEPVPGRCKTRLCPPLRPAEAAELAAAALEDTLAAVAEAHVARRVLALEGSPGPWLPDGFDLVAQSAGGLGARLAGAFGAVGGPGLLIGMDTPQLAPSGIEAAAAALCADRVDAVLGPAYDGGYWAIGLQTPCPTAFDRVPMSSPRTAELQRRRLRELGLRLAELPMLRDFDTIDDASAVAALCPESCFARSFEGLRWDAAA